jgi:hypothetical protein
MSKLTKLLLARQSIIEASKERRTGGGIEQRKVTDKDGNESFEVGLAFAHYVDNRQKATLLPIITKRIVPG